MENYKTIKELADELGTSKYIVKYQVDKLDKKHIEKCNNKIFIDETGQIHVKNVLNNPLLKTEESFAQTEEKYGNKEFAGEELFAEIEEKNKQIEQLHDLIDQQQQLTLQANKQIEQLQSQLVFLLTDNDEQAMMKEESFDDKKENESVKKWYHFWK